MSVRRLAPAEVPHAVDVLCDAFHAYPVMQFVLGSGHEDYDRRLRLLVEFFVSARVWRDEPVLAAVADGGVIGVALVTLPGDRPSPSGLLAHRERLWTSLGAAARARYDAFGTACRAFALDRPHHHLNMIGVRRAHLGRGVARQLLEAVHELAAGDPASCGVTLTTEDRRNVPLYEHVGYALVGRVRVAAGLESWGFFRARDGGE